MRDVPARPVMVLHVAGLHGTGSTVLANVLGELDGLFNAGELVYLAQALERGDPCGCGQPIADCPFWSAALGSIFPTPREAIVDLRPQRAWLDAARLPALLLAERRNDPDLARYRTTLGKLCQAIARESGARIVVETSKHPPFGRVLALTPGTETFVVHLVRDPRASSYAWERVTRSPLRPLLVGATWTTWHLTVPRLWPHARYLALRYEDFVRAPRRAVLDILAFLGEPEQHLPFVGEHAVRLGTNHMPTGNRNRFRTGLVDISAHDEWRTSLGAGRAAATLATAAPLLRSWGYSIRG